MGHGGKREGAGRKGGTTPIKPRKLSAERLAAQLDVTPERTPLAFLLAVMRDELVDKEGKPVEVKFTHRLQAAIQAAPFVHPRLASVEVKGNASEPLTLQSDIGRALKELAERARQMKVIDAEAMDVLEPATLPEGQGRDAGKE